ncbi:MAG: ATP-binding protein, partial [Smithella sp.]
MENEQASGTDILLDALIREEESSTLDFKRDQYKFIHASDFEKAELLKDILAFCNAFRRTDAYIIIGVDEVKGGESIIFGITELLDDSQIQQFVNGKTQRPIDFLYKNVPYRGKQIALIKIPLQQRPIYLKQNYGCLKKNVVYIRRGSSTAEATPDEIADMRSTNLTPSSNLIPKLVLN